MKVCVSSIEKCEQLFDLLRLTSALSKPAIIHHILSFLSTKITAGRSKFLSEAGGGRLSGQLSHFSTSIKHGLMMMMMMMAIVTHCFEPYMLIEMVYILFKSKAGVQFKVAGRLTKAKKKEMFFESCFSWQLLSLSFPFAAEIVRILRLIRSLYNGKFVPLLSGL